MIAFILALRFCSLRRILPRGNGGFPRWHLTVWGRAHGGLRVLLHVIVPRFQYCQWVEWPRNREKDRANP